MSNIFSEAKREKFYSYLICIFVVMLVYYAFANVPLVNSNSCNSFGDKKELCLAQFAKENNDYTICTDIKNDTIKFFCYKETNMEELKRQYCERDGTIIGKCSMLNKGFFCQNGELIPKCNSCECPSDYPYCNEDGRCYR